MFEKTESANSLPFAVHFHMGAYFCMDAYKCNVVVVIKMGAYIYESVFCVGAYYPDFTVCSHCATLKQKAAFMLATHLADFEIDHTSVVLSHVCTFFSTKSGM